MRRADSRSKAPWCSAVLLLLVFLFSTSWMYASDTVSVFLFPAESFHRDTGRPTAVVRTFSVPAAEGVFSLHVVNGDGATDNLVSSAVVKVNGVTLVRPSDLSQQAATLDKPLSNLVKGNNTLEVEVRSIPSSYITVSINGTYMLGVHVTEPPPFPSIDSNKVTVKGTWVGYTNDVGVAVNGVPAAISGNTFVATDVPLVPGDNPLAATATTFEGIKNTDTVTVTATGNKPFLALWANYVSGVPPFTVSFRTEVEGITPLEYRYDFDGDGVVDNMAITDDAIDFQFTVPGTFRTTVIAVDGEGNQYATEKTIVSQDRVATDTLLANRWHSLSSSLQAQDIQGALFHLLPESRPDYQAIFSPLTPQLPTIFASISPPELIAVEGDLAQYRVKREQLWDGTVQTITYYLWIVQDEDGVWRIDRF